MDPHFPLYIVSKGRWDSRLTSRALEEMKVPYHIIVESQEFDSYASVIDPKKILILDKQFQRDYDTCDDFGDTRSKGSGPARNFAWEHSISQGHKFHWVMDDNIRAFRRFNNNYKAKVLDGSFFRAMEDFVLRYTNIYMAGPNYAMFCPRKQKRHPFAFNCRIYSCNLIRNDTPFRWRCRYNEDVDLSLRILKKGLCTVLFHAFLQEKMATMTMKGGNHSELYSKFGTLDKSQALQRVHPDVTTIVHKFGRWHHSVDYSKFRKNIVRKRTDINIPSDPNEYNLTFVDDYTKELNGQ